MHAVVCTTDDGGTEQSRAEPHIAHQLRGKVLAMDTAAEKGTNVERQCSGSEPEENENKWRKRKGKARQQ